MSLLLADLLHPDNLHDKQWSHSNDIDHCQEVSPYLYYHFLHHYQYREGVTGSVLGFSPYTQIA